MHAYYSNMREQQDCAAEQINILQGNSKKGGIPNKNYKSEAGNWICTEFDTGVADSMLLLWVKFGDL